MNKEHTQTFSFMMEMIIVIFFFCISATVCVLLLASSKEKIDTAKQMQTDYVEAENIINLLQSQPIDTIDDLIENNNQYTYHDLTIIIETKDNIQKGVITMSNNQQISFVIGKVNEE
jgi:Tfp pilus assembly protein PilV